MKDKFLTFLDKIKAKYRSMSKRRRILYGVGLVVLILIIVGIGGKKDDGEDTLVVAPQVLSKTVQVTGKLTSDVDLTLSFEKAGSVRDIRVAVGQDVKAGTILATLEAAEEYADVKRAENNLASAKAQLAAAQSAQDALVEAAYRTLLSDDLVAEPTAKDTDEVPPEVRGLYTGMMEGEYIVHAELAINTGPTNAIYKVSGLEKDLDDDNDIILGRYVPIGIFGLSMRFPDDFTVSGYDTDWKIAVPNTEGENYAANYNAYQNALATRDLELAQKQGDVLTKEADLTSVYATLENTIIRAPSSGKVTKIDIQKGERVEALQEVIALQDVNNLYVEADVNESNIVGLKPGQIVSITFDALTEEEVFSGSVSDIDIAPSDDGEVTNYTITALIDSPDGMQNPILRPGMTANMTIMLFKDEAVIAIPRRALIPGDDGWYVDVLDEKENTSRVKVSLGRDADGGLVEVTSGLSGGETIDLDPKEE